MELTIILPEGNNTMISVLFFAAVGALYGWLLKDIGILKILALIMVTPAIYEFLVKTDNLLMVTLPFVLTALGNYYGFRNAFYFAEDLYHDARSLWERRP